MKPELVKTIIELTVRVVLAILKNAEKEGKKPISRMSKEELAAAVRAIEVSDTDELIRKGIEQG